MDSQNNQKRFLYYLAILIALSLPGKVYCLDVEQCSSFILYILFVLFFLALLGNYKIKRDGYMQINDKIKSSTKL